MFKVKNNLNQPIDIDGKTLPADGEITVGKASEEEVAKLVAKGHISLIQPAEKPGGGPATDPAKDGGKTK